MVFPSKSRLFVIGSTIAPLFAGFAVSAPAPPLRTSGGMARG